MKPKTKQRRHPQSTYAARIAANNARLGEPRETPKALELDDLTFRYRGRGEQTRDLPGVRKVG